MGQRPSPTPSPPPWRPVGGPGGRRAVLARHAARAPAPSATSSPTAPKSWVPARTSKRCASPRPPAQPAAQRRRRRAGARRRDHLGLRATPRPPPRWPRRGTPLVGYPALVDQGDSVGVKVANTAEKATRWQALGLAPADRAGQPRPDPFGVRAPVQHRQDRPVVGALRQPERAAGRRPAARHRRPARRAPHRPDAVRDPPPSRRGQGRRPPDAAERMQAVTRLAASIAGPRPRAIRAALARQAGPSAADARAQLDNLVFPGFIAATPEPHFTRLDRYLHALQVRLDGWQSHPARERQHLDTISALEEAYEAAIAGYPVGELPPPPSRWAGCWRSCGSACSPSRWGRRSPCRPSGCGPLSRR
jgi:hypothetical protein